MPEPPPSDQDRAPDEWLPPASRAPTDPPDSVAVGSRRQPAVRPLKPSVGRLLGIGTVLTGVALIVIVVVLFGPSILRGNAPAPSASSTSRQSILPTLEEQGLDCVDEAYEPWLIKGCYVIAPERIVTVRMKVDTEGVIEKFQVQVLDGTVAAVDRNAEFSRLLNLMLQAAEVPPSDQEVITKAVAAGTVLEFEQLDWGELYLPAEQPTVRTVTLTRADVQPSALNARAVLGSWPDLQGALTELGYRCRVKNEASYTCDGKRPGEQISGAVHANGVLTVNIWFEGPLPATDAPLLKDVRAALGSVADPRAAAFDQGMTRLVDENEEQVFVANCRILRWQQRLEISSVDFA